MSNIKLKNKWVKYIAIGGLGLAFLRASYYFLKKEWENSQSMLSKDLVIKVLQEVRYEACPVFLMVAAYDGSRDIAQDMKNELIDRGNPNQSLMPSMLNTRMMSTDLL